MDSYKLEHEAFVSNIKGTSVGCVLVCLLHIPAFILLLKLFQNKRKPRIIRDLVFLIIPLLLSITVLADHNYWSFVCIIIVSIIFMSSTDTQEDLADDTNENKSLDDNSIHQNSTTFITLYKGSVVLITCICILAVDFRVFPRRFAKTETFGVSLMDIGVGFFIISSGLTSKFARGIVSTNESNNFNCLNNNNSINRKEKFCKIIKYFIYNNIISYQRLIVLLMGIGRFTLLKLLNYQEHISEYGIHWNFFVTLFCVWVICDGLHKLIKNRKYMIWISIFGLIMYQILLTKTNLTDYILNAPRKNIFSMNKEGICSLFGYIPLYLITECLSSYIYFDNNISNNINNNNNNNNNSIGRTTTNNNEILKDNESIFNDDDLIFNNNSNNTICNTIDKNNNHHLKLIPVWNQKIIKQSIITICVLWIVWIFSASIQPTSRRLTNLTYISLVLSLSFTVLFIIYLVDTYTNGSKINIASLQYMSKYSLLVFLIANICTGLINMSIRTIYISKILSTFIITVYIIFLTIFSWLMEFFSTKSFKAR